MDREKALDMAVGQIEKQYGKGAVMRLGDQANQKVPSIPTGAISLDLALGVGGIPRGRVTEIYGPEASGKSSLALHVAAEAQQAGGIAAFIDAEHALDPGYAKALGVDTEELLVSQPDTGEQALEIADMLVRSGAVDVIVIDSVAALTPKAEIEGEMGDSHVGLQARLMSQALRKLSGTLHRSRTSAVFINQLREKVGVMFGCFDHSTGVTLADGTQEKIGEIVDQRLPAEVLSYDAERDEVVPRTVTNWFDNGPTDGFLRFTVAKPSEGESGQFACTPNHLIRTPGGWREAAELCEGDRVLQTVTTYLSDEQWEVVLGSLMGGGTLSRDDGRAARLRFEHGVGEIAYAEWKASLLSNISVDRRVDARGAVQHETQPLAELEGLRRSVFLADRMVLSDEHLKQLTPRALAICYMDSGDLADGPADQAEIEVERLAPGSRERLRQHLRDAWGLTGELTTKAATAVLRFSHEATPKLENLIAAHVHPSMEHKLSPAHRERFADQTLVGEPAERLMALPITSVAWEPAAEGSHRYDLEVDGTHNYFVDGVMVHNSPETTPGGRALKFYSSVRLDVRRIESLKDGNDAIGNRVRVKVVKNKVAPPFRQAEFDLMYGTGISKEGALLDLGVDHGVVKKAGAWYTYEGEQLGQGRENAKKFLAEHDDVAQAITKQLHEQLGLVPTDIAGEEATETGGPAEAAEDGAGGEATKGSNGNKGAKGGNGSKSSGGAKPAEPAGAGSAEAGDGDG